MNEKSRSQSGDIPRGSDLVLRLLVGARRWESISGDLLEEYRDSVLPTQGRTRAQLWYWNQVLTCARPIHLGLLLGGISAVVVVLTNVILPSLQWEISSNSAVESLCIVFCFGGSLIAWAAVGGLVRRRGEGIKRSVYGGAVAAMLHMGLVMMAFVIVNNLFLEIVRMQPDKIWGFQHSGYASMRTYVNYAAMRGFCFALPIFTALGALCGAVGALSRRVSPLRLDR